MRLERARSNEALQQTKSAPVFPGRGAAFAAELQCFADC